MTTSNWANWGQRLGAIAQNGLEFSTDPYDIKRYQEIREIASEMLAQVGNDSPEDYHRLLLADLGYATPKVDVRGALFQDNKILLVRERSDGGWTLPGGWADVGDSPSEAVLREIWEESGFEAKVIKLAALFDRNKHPHPPHPQHIYKLFFLCEITGGSPQESNETDGVRFFGEDEIPNLSLGRTTPGQIQRLFKHYRDPGLPTDYD